MPHICKICGDTDKHKFSEPTQSRLEREELCFNCDFWMEKVPYADDPRSVRVKGTHYFIGEENAAGSRGFRGFAGHRFVIKFDDGREVISTNLWCQGDIPPYFKELLPDNATFARQ